MTNLYENKVTFLDNTNKMGKIIKFSSKAFAFLMESIEKVYYEKWDRNLPLFKATYS